MGQTEFTGKAMTVSVATGTTLEGVTKVTINEVGGPDIDQLDATVSGDSAYTYLADPLGAKGDPKATLTITCQDSSVSYADSKATKLLPAGGAVAFAAGVTQYDNTWAHAGMTLTKRTTKITWAPPIATVELVYEANSLGTWAAVA
jgi:hypothetical protein